MGALKRLKRLKRKYYIDMQCASKNNFFCEYWAIMPMRRPHKRVYGVTKKEQFVPIFAIKGFQPFLRNFNLFISTFLLPAILARVAVS